MNITMHYSKRSYGVSEDESDFVVKASSDKSSVHLHFDFPNMALGRGVGANVGAVESASLNFTREEAIAIANLILLAASTDANVSEERFFGSVTADSRNFWRRFLKWRRDNPKASLADFK